MFGNVASLFKGVNLAIDPRRLSEKPSLSQKPFVPDTVSTQEKVATDDVSHVTAPEDLRRRTTIGYGAITNEQLKTPTTSMRDDGPKLAVSVETPNPGADEAPAEVETRAKKTSALSDGKSRRTASSRPSAYKLLYLGRETSFVRDATWYTTKNASGDDEEMQWENYAYPTSTMCSSSVVDYHNSQSYEPSNTNRVPISLVSGLGMAQKKKDDPRRSITEKVDLNGATTIMLRNIPNRYTKEMLFDEFCANGMMKSIDFFYLPQDRTTGCNVGYCFLNLISQEAAEKFVNIFHNIQLNQIKSKKICQVSVANVQGQDANIQQYRNSAVMNTMDERFRPMVLENGQRQPFPEPTKSHEELLALWSQNRASRNVRLPTTT